MGGIRGTALVVEGHRWMRDEVADWLEWAGFRVLGCSGPTGPEYTCAGSTGDACVLARVASVIVLDLRLAPDDAGVGTPAFELLRSYGRLGKPLVLLSGQSDPVVPFPEPTVRVIRRPPTRSELIAEVEGALTAGREARAV
jgi:hypothetical protein